MTCLCRHRMETEMWLQSTSNPTTEGSGWPAPRPDPFTPRKRSGTLCTGSWMDLGACVDGTENISCTGTRSPDLYASVESYTDYATKASFSYYVMHSDVPTGGELKRLQHFYNTGIVSRVCETKSMEPAFMGQNRSAESSSPACRENARRLLHRKVLPRQQYPVARSDRETNGYVLCSIVT
jgi:hypothetical protein